MRSEFDSSNWLIAIIILGLLLVDVVAYWRRHRTNASGQLAPRDTVSNVFIFAGHNAIAALIFWFVGSTSLKRVLALSPLRFHGTWWTFLLALVLIDFVYYWQHRIEHKVAFLWAQHSVHHSTNELNLSTGLRLSWFSGWIFWIFWIPEVAIGFPIAQLAAANYLVWRYQLINHTELIGKLGFLEKIIVTPSSHRVHHGVNKQYLDRNFGGFFIIWDRMFGTYEPEVEAVDYGTAFMTASRNPITVNVKPVADVVRRAVDARGPRAKLNALFGPPV